MKYVKGGTPPAPAESGQELLDAALALAADGVGVFPCHRVVEDACTCSEAGACKSPGKHPRTKEGSKEATTDPAKIRLWWAQWGKHGRLNFGQTLLGRAVVDIDVAGGKPGLQTWESLLEAAFPEDPDTGISETCHTLTYRTGRGGTQLVYALPAGQMGGKADGYGAKLGDGVDFKTGPNAYVMVPGSRTDDVYTVVVEAEAAELPEWIAELARAPKTKTTTIDGKPVTVHGGSLLTELLLLPPDHPGRGNDWLAKVAGHYAKQYRGKKDLYLTHCELANAGSADPIEPGSFTKTVESIWAADQKTYGGLNLRGFTRSDWGNAERLVAAFGEDLRYAPGRGWFIWDGRLWAADETGEVTRKAVETTRILLAEAQALTEDKHKADWSMYAIKMQAKGALTAMVELASKQVGVVVEAKRLDQDPFKLLCADGVIDLRTGTLREAERTDLITKGTGVGYAAGATDADCPQFLKWMNWFTQGNTALVAYLQKMIGVTLLGTNAHQVVPFLYGGGENGKSTLINLIGALLGDYTAGAQPGLIAGYGDLGGGGNGHTADLASLAGARFVPIPETQKGQRMNENRVKQLSGDKGIQVSFKGQNPFWFDPAFTIWIFGNHHPIIQGSDDGIWRRIKLIKTNAKVAPGDKKLDFEKLLLAAEGPAIMAWAVRGAMVMADAGAVLQDAPTVAEDVAEYRDSQNVIGKFAEEHLTFGYGKKILTEDLWSRYVMWTADGGDDFVKSKTELVNTMIDWAVMQGHPVKRAPGLRMGHKRGKGLTGVAEGS